MPNLIEKLNYTDERSPTRLRWTRSRCSTLKDAGLIDGRYELIEGEIISKMGQKFPHACVVALITGWLTQIFRFGAVIIQLPVLMTGPDEETSEPEPDAAVLKCSMGELAGQLPNPTDTVILLEVADSSLSFDLNTKAALYARNGIPEYWVIDVSGRQIYVHRKPTTRGYTEIAVYSENEKVATLAKPESMITVSALLPPAI